MDEEDFRNMSKPAASRGYRISISFIVPNQSCDLKRQDQSSKTNFVWTSDHSQQPVFSTHPSLKEVFLLCNKAS